MHYTWALRILGISAKSDCSMFLRPGRDDGGSSFLGAGFSGSSTIFVR